MFPNLQVKADNNKPKSLVISNPSLLSSPSLVILVYAEFVGFVYKITLILYKAQYIFILYAGTFSLIFRKLIVPGVYFIPTTQL